ncbi:MAG: single-stranded DNA-binding protein [Acidimicrobiales bacterium]
MNVVVLRGKLSRPPEMRELDSGTRLVRYEITSRDAEGKAETAPVSWLGAPESAGTYDAGDEVVVVGRVRRRWFRRGSITESRVEVAAELVVSARHGKRVTSAVDRAIAVLQSVDV